jgi:hypothetical protein
MVQYVITYKISDSVSAKNIPDRQMVFAGTVKDLCSLVLFPD